MAIHPLDPLAPLKHADGRAYSEEERYAFFVQAEKFIRGNYRDDRALYFTHHLNVGDQLDMLWHEVNATGTVSKDGTWFKAIQAVKEAHPNTDAAYQKALADVQMLRQKNQGA